ncbi:MAG: VanW family protein [Lachnospiraceae bacterium]|nr:VanW family protein [Lachnospiraceae bacterium]
MRLSRVLTVGVITCATVVSGVFLLTPKKTVTVASASQESNSVIPKNIKIAGVDVSGMTAEEAGTALDDYAKQVGDREITLKSEDGSVKVKASNLGLCADSDEVVTRALNYGSMGNLVERYMNKEDLSAGKEKDYELNLSVDSAKTMQYLQDNEAQLVSEAVDNGLKRENGAFVFVPGKDGHSLDLEQSLQAVQDFAAEDYLKGKDTVRLVTKTSKPRGSRKELSQITDVLGSFSTDFSSSTAARAQNVRNGASKIDGTLLYPGEVFSVAQTLNPMTAENGYAQAPSYENGTTVMTYGGGICQVSTTLYNAVIRAELGVVERSSHSMVVHYVDPSDDAAIAGDVKDFKFKNTYDTPVYIEGYTTGGVIHFNVYGKETRDSNRSIEFVSEIVSQTDPKDVFKADGSLPLGTVTRTSGQAHTGYVARLWKIVKKNGKVVSKKVFNNSRYRSTDNEYVVGTKSDNPEAVAAVNAAISSGDYSTVTAAAAKWKNVKAPEEDNKDQKDTDKKSDDKKSDDKKNDNKKKDSNKENKPSSKEESTKKTN